MGLSLSKQMVDTHSYKRPMISNNYQDILNQIDEIPIIDTHEHFLPPSFFADGDNTLLRLVKNSYMGRDLISAGMQQEWWEEGSIIYGPTDLTMHHTTGDSDLDTLFSYLKLTKHTCFTRAFMTGLHKTYGIDQELDIDVWGTFTNLAKKAYSSPEKWFDTTLAKTKIRKVILDPYYNIEDPYLWSEKLYVGFRVDDFIFNPVCLHPAEGKTAAKIHAEWDFPYNNIDDILDTIDDGFEYYQKHRGISTKIGVAYRRSLFFDICTRFEAEQAFDTLKKCNNHKAMIILGNFVFRHILKRSIEADFVIQFHTGYNRGFLEQTNPTQLVNLFRSYPEAKFVIFHGSYPYSNEAGLLLKAFSNVFMDICWMPMLSTRVSEEMLLRWVDLVPINKLMWGGDVWSVEECYGAVSLFKDVLTRVLSRLIDEERFNKKEALGYAKRIMNKNAAELFKIDSVN